MTSLTVFLLFLCTVVTCYTLPVQKSIEPLEIEEIKEVEHRILGELKDDVRRKRDIYEYSYSASTKTESSVNFSMKRTETGNHQMFIIGPGENNQNYVKISLGT
nr:uncharacterized protein LOC117986976 [Maniola hyperantus]